MEIRIPDARVYSEVKLMLALLISGSSGYFRRSGKRQGRDNRPPNQENIERPDRPKRRGMVRRRWGRNVRRGSARFRRAAEMRRTERYRRRADSWAVDSFSTRRNSSIRFAYRELRKSLPPWGYLQRIFAPRGLRPGRIGAISRIPHRATASRKREYRGAGCYIGQQWRLINDVITVDTS